MVFCFGRFRSLNCLKALTNAAPDQKKIRHGAVIIYSPEQTARRCAAVKLRLNADILTRHCCEAGADASAGGHGVRRKPTCVTVFRIGLPAACSALRRE